MAAAFAKDIELAYEQVIMWRRNVFIVPFGAAGATFAQELAALIEAFVRGNSPMSRVAWKAVVVACHVLLQKPNDSKLLGGHSDHLRRRLALWSSYRLSELLDEARCIQNHLQPYIGRTSGQSTRDFEVSDDVFSSLVFSGRVKSAIRHLSPDSSGGVLRMDDIIDEQNRKTVHDVLRAKHPPPAPVHDRAMLKTDPVPVNPIMFDKITPELIRKFGRRMQGSAGPSGLDADAWCRLLTCFKSSSDNLCRALCSAARAIYAKTFDGDTLSAFTAARLIPLDKKPGVRPIAVGEVFRRLIGKAIMAVIEVDVRKATAPFQACVGVPSGCETAVHAMTSLFECATTEGILLVDASNTFNSLNRSVALHNVPRVCPALGRVFQNTYSKPIRLIVAGQGEIYSREGTCQGDPLAMAIYSVSLMPLVHQLEDLCPGVTQAWFADDDAGASKLTKLRDYWGHLLCLGPDYGYYPNAQKTALVTKEQHLSEAEHLFNDTGIEITTAGHRYLGGTLGSKAFREDYYLERVARWQVELTNLANMARTQPQAAYHVFTTGFLGKWLYYLRSTQCDSAWVESLDRVIDCHFLSALMGKSVAAGSAERELLSFPVRFGGMAVPILSVIVEREFEASCKVTAPVVLSMVNAAALRQRPPTPVYSRAGDGTALDDFALAISTLLENARNVHRKKITALNERLNSIKGDLSSEQQLLVDIAAEKGVSSWLTSRPAWQHGSILSKSDFRDALCIRYGHQLTGLPDSCVCGDALTTSHAFTCPAGGYPSARHDEIRDLLADVLCEAGLKDVETEPSLLPFEGEDLPGKSANRSAEARLDIKARGFWSRQQDAFFDVRITHPKASAQCREKILSQLKEHERAKKRQYGARVTQIQRGSFTPIVLCTNGIFGPEATIFLKSLAALLAERNRDIPYSVIMSQLRCRISFCLVRWCVTCFRGCRASYIRRERGSFLAQCRKN